MSYYDIKILIVEDEFIALEYLKKTLEKLKFKNIFEARSADEAIDIVSSNEIDLLFMDININGKIDGIECTIIINDLYYSIPTIFTTAYGDSQTIDETKNCNCFGYLIKPFSVQDIEATIKTALNLIEKMNCTTKYNKKSDSSKVIKLNDGYVYNIKQKTLTLNNEYINLTKKEAELLDLFCKHLNQNISYEMMQEFIWDSKEIALSTIRDTVSRLKNKVPKLFIENISNYGYVLKTQIPQ